MPTQRAQKKKKQPPANVAAGAAPVAVPAAVPAASPKDGAPAPEETLLGFEATSPLPRPPFGKNVDLAFAQALIDVNAKPGANGKSENAKFKAAVDMLGPKYPDLKVQF